MSSCNLYLFGTPRIELDGKVKALSRRKTIALLAYLAMTNKAHSRDHLATLFWPDYDQTSARANLRRDLSRLKNGLGAEQFIIDRNLAGMNPDGDWQLDVADFFAHIAKVQAHNHFPQQACTQCLAACNEALALYTADFMVGFSLPDCAEFDDWQFFQADGLRQTLAELLQRMVQWHTAQGEYEQAIEYGRRWLVIDALHEETHQHLMRLYNWAGQHNAALRQYEECVRIFNDELGVTPAQETSDLYELIRSRQLEAPTMERTTETAVAKDDPPEPKTLDPAQRYVIQEQLDSGGHGDVYLGEDRRTGETVVVKRIKPELIDKDRVTLARFQREADILRQLNHPNIVRMLDIYEKEDVQHLVMEYVPGGTLRNRLRGRTTPLPLEEALKIALELADALSRAHHLGVIHRDIKPENVLFAQDNSLRLTDFGMARLENVDVRLTQTGVLLGSPAYMSPEALQGDKVDVRTDIWSFGILLYEMLAGRPPFGNDQLTTTIVQILNDPTPDLKKIRPDLPPALADLVQQMLAKQPMHRIATIRQVAAVLDTIQDGRMPPQLTPTHITPVPGQISVTTAGTPLPFVHQIPNNLPSQPTPFVGRAEELRQIQTLLVEDTACRMLTLFGQSGMGKTRLALEAGTQILSGFPDGVYFISFAAINELELIVLTMAENLPMQFSGAATPKAQLIHFLRAKQMLLILDNFDQLLTGAELLTEILRLAPGIKLLITVEERFGLQEEWSLEVGKMPFPEEAAALNETQLFTFGAPQLFIQRARRADASFVIDSDKVPSVARICSLLQGMPLSLELVAPRVRSASCPDIAREIEETIDVSAAATEVVTQTGLHSIFTQTWQTLSAEQQTTLRRLTVFQGGCQREAAEVVVQTTFPVLASLVDLALIQQDGNGRFTLHQRIRQFVREKLGDGNGNAKQILDSHSQYYLSLLFRQTKRLKGEKQARALDLISSEVDNLRAAWQHAVVNKDWPSLLAAAETVWLFSEFQGFLHQGEGAFSLVLDGLAATDENDAFKGYFLAGQGSMMAQRGWLLEGVPKIEAGLQLLETTDQVDAQKIAFVEMWFASALVAQGEFEQAEPHAQNAFNAFAETQDHWTKANSLRLLGTVAFYQGELAAAEKYFDECLVACSQIGDQRIQTTTRATLGTIFMMRGDYGRSQQWFNEAMELSGQIGDRLSRVELLRDQGLLAIQQGQYAQAAEYLAQSKAISGEIGRPISGEITCAQGIIHYRQGDVVGAKALFQNGLAAAKATHNQAGVAKCLTQLAIIACDEGVPDHAEQLLQDAYAIWQEIGNEPMMAEVDCRIGHVIASCDMTRKAEAQLFFQYALEAALAHDLAPVAIDAIVGLASLMLVEGETETAVSALNLAIKHPASTITTKNSGKTALNKISDDVIAKQQKNQTLTDWHALGKQFIKKLKVDEEAAQAAKSNVPTQDSSFVGRSRELAELQMSLLQDKVRLLTIVGPGGIGKTSLGVALAESVANRFKHGVFYVSLAPLELAEHLLTAVAESLEFHLTPTEDPTDQLLNYLQTKQLLLVFDNYEHLLPNTNLIAKILTGVPNVQVLVTSRQRLNLGEEVVFPLGGLSFPQSDVASVSELLRFGSVELFLQQVRVMDANYEFQERDKAALIEICQLVQGMPLALILAAGWVDMLSFAEIAEEITMSLDFLESERRDLPERQRSVRAVFAGSWQQLHEDVQKAFACLSVFRGGFTRQAAQKVAGANLRTLRKLVNNSFISVQENGRYEIHELMRQFGAEQLQTWGEADEMRAAHSTYFLTFLGEREADIKGKRQVEAIAEIEMDFENILSAWNWGVRHEDRQGIDGAMEALHLFCDMLSRYQEGDAFFKQALSHLEPLPGQEPDLTYGRLLTRHGFLQVFFPNKWDEALQELKDASIIVSRYEEGAEIALNHLAQGSYVFTALGDPEKSETHFQQALAIFEEIGDDFYHARCLVSMSFCYAVLGQLDRSLQVVEDGMVIAKRNGSKADLAYGLTNIGEHAIGVGEYEKAIANFRGAIEASDFVRSSVLLSYSRALLGFVLWLNGEMDEARDLMKTSLKLAESKNHAIAIAYAQAAICLWSAVFAETDAAKHWAQSSYDNPANNTLGLILAQWGLALANLNEGNWTEAHQASLLMLQEAEAANYPAPLLWILPQTAVFAVHHGELEKALSLLAIAVEHSLGAVGWLDHWPLFAQVQAQLKDELEATAYEAAWQAGQAMLREMDGETAVSFVRSTLEEYKP